MIALPLLYTLGVVRTVLIMVLATIYLVFVTGACTLLVRGCQPCGYALIRTDSRSSNTQGRLIRANSTPV